MNKTQNRNAYLILSLLAVLAVPVYLYGLRPLILAAVAVVSALLCDIICKRLFHLPKKKRDLSSVVTALVVVLALPATVDYAVVVIAVLSGLLIAKYPFGGTGNLIFNPAALGLAVAGLSFPEQVLRFPAVKTMLGLAPSIQGEGIMYATSPASVLNVGGTPQITRFDLLLGSFPGAMGATCILVLGIIMLFLIVRRVISIWIAGSFLLTATAYAIFSPRIFTGRTNSVIFELSSGILLFGLIFMASDSETSPKNALGQILYGFLLAVCTMLFRTVGSLDIEIAFVLLFTNALSGEFDKLGTFLTDKFMAKLPAGKQKVGETHD